MLHGRPLVVLCRWVAQVLADCERIAPLDCVMM
jgi:hypothetical protein